MKTRDQIAIEIANGMPEFIWREGSEYGSGVSEDQVIQFARRLVEALNCQEPVAWMNPDGYLTHWRGSLTPLEVQQQ